MGAEAGAEAGMEGKAENVADVEFDVNRNCLDDVDVSGRRNWKIAEEEEDDLEEKGIEKRNNSGTSQGSVDSGIEDTAFCIV